MEAKTPARRALAVLDTPPPAEPIGKALRITARVRRAVDLMVSGQCKKILEAAAAVGMHHDSLSRALTKPHVTEHMRQKVIKRLAIAAARAGHTKIELLDSDNEMVRDRASTFVLGLADIAPASAPALSVNLEIKAGYVIDLSDEPKRSSAGAHQDVSDHKDGLHQVATLGGANGTLIGRDGSTFGNAS